jgi:hypothetical protein
MQPPAGVVELVVEEVVEVVVEVVLKDEVVGW